MGIKSVNKIDFLDIQKESGNVTLTVADGEDWCDEKEHVFLLQEKLNRYLAFVESGEVFEVLEESLGYLVPKPRRLRFKSFLSTSRQTSESDSSSIQKANSKVVVLHSRGECSRKYQAPVVIDSDI